MPFLPTIVTERRYSFSGVFSDEQFLAAMEMLMFGEVIVVEVATTKTEFVNSSNYATSHGNYLAANANKNEHTL